MVKLVKLAKHTDHGVYNYKACWIVGLKCELINLGLVQLFLDI